MNIPFVKIYVERGTYWADSNDMAVNSLGDFLRDMGGDESSVRVIEYLYNDKFISINTDRTSIDKEGDYINIKPMDYDTEKFTEETIPYLRIHRDEFARVLRAWHDFTQSNEKEFLVTLEDGKIQIAATKDYQ
ncbi:MAG: hypothetical protein M1114_03100 [Candidatus Dependentiae bacterium]|nr:hypothetical protein [Candidatus Dependentiae bacterium]